MKKTRLLTRWTLIIGGVIFLLLITLVFPWRMLWLKSCFSQNDTSSFKILDTKTEATPMALALPVQITDKSIYDALNFNPLKKKWGIITYNLSKPAWVRMRIKHRREKGLLLRTLFDWSKRQFGENQERWDSRDESDNLIDNKSCFILIEANSKMHAHHERAKCQELRLKINLPNESGTRISKFFTLKAAIVEGGRGYGLERGYKVSYYIDYRLVERRQYSKGIEQFDFKLDTTKYSNGRHMITINVDDYHDHIGTSSIVADIVNE